VRGFKSIASLIAAAVLLVIGALGLFVSVTGLNATRSFDASSPDPAVARSVDASSPDATLTVPDTRLSDQDSLAAAEQCIEDQPTGSFEPALTSLVSRVVPRTGVDRLKAIAVPCADLRKLTIIDRSGDWPGSYD